MNKTPSFTLLLVCLALASPAALPAQLTFTVSTTSVGVVTASQTSGIAIGDLNGDGHADLVVLARHIGSPNFAIIQLGNGDGTYKPGGAFLGGTGSVGVVIGDFNGDKKADLAISNANSNDVSILLGKGDGTFPTATSVPVGTSLAGIATADFNGDGKLDLAVAAVDTKQVLILLGKGDSAFQAAVSYSAGTAPVAVLAVDVNGDGKPDLVITDQGPAGGTGTVSVLVNKGDGTFEAAKQYNIGQLGVASAAGDFNHDGNMDLAVVDSGGLSVLLGNGDGTFQALSHVTTVGQGGVGVGDFDGDGNLDIAVTDAGATVSFFVGNGDGTFYTPGAIFAGRSPAALAVGDFNKDGLTDLAVADIAAPSPGGPSPAIYFAVLVDHTPALTTPVINTVVNGASFQFGISASSWITIQGKNLSTTTRSWAGSDFVNNQLPTSLDGVSVNVNGLPAYTYFISSGQLNVLAPDDSTKGPVVVEVKNAAGTSNTYSANKTAVSPAFFLFNSKYPAAVHTNGALVGPVGLIPGATVTPAQPGETIMLFGTGFGPTNPPLPAAQIVAAAEPLANTATVTLATENAVVQFAGLSGSGLDQINIVVPLDLPDGDAPIVATVDGVSTPTGLFITVHH